MATNDSEPQQGASYPYVSLSHAMSIAEAVKECGGTNAPVQKSLLASRLREDEKSQGFTFKIGAAKCYGLIEGRSSYTLSEEAKRFFYPTTDQDKNDALLSFLASPLSFSEIIKRFDGTKLPAPELLANIFYKELRVPQSWSSRSASFFTRAAQFVGAIDEQGFLRFNAAKQAGGSANSISRSESENPSPPTSQPAKLSPANNRPGYHPYVLPLPNGREVFIQAPLDITAQEIKRLQKWIEFTLQIDWSDPNA